MLQGHKLEVKLKLLAISHEVQAEVEEHCKQPVINTLHKGQAVLFRILLVRHIQSPLDNVKFFVVSQLVQDVKDVQTKHPVAQLWQLLVEFKNVPVTQLVQFIADIEQVTQLKLHWGQDVPLK